MKNRSCCSAPCGNSPKTKSSRWRAKIDETGHFPRETFRKGRRTGLTAVALPESEGGAGFDHIAYSIVH